MKGYDVKEQGFIIGTTMTTILTAPVNYYAEITDIRYSNPTGTVVSGYLYETIGGTIVGTIDAFVIPAGSPLIIHSGDRPVAKLNAGRSIQGAVNTGSIIGVIVYAFSEGRS